LRPAALQCGHLVREEAMIGKSDSALADLSPRVQEVLGDFVEAARVAFGSDLRAVVLAVELAPDGIRVNAVCPGVIKNERWAERIAGIARVRGVSEEAAALARENVPLGRLGTHEDVAPVVVFLASPVAAAYITGVSVDVDGGLGRGVAIRGAG
jgi:NAD(P)-dependent dehydrogenase (short-subunit alcohol dehydrogenase family)